MLNQKPCESQIRFPKILPASGRSLVNPLWPSVDQHSWRYANCAVRVVYRFSDAYFVSQLVASLLMLYFEHSSASNKRMRKADEDQRIADCKILRSKPDVLDSWTILGSRKYLSPRVRFKMKQLSCLIHHRVSLESRIVSSVF